MGKLVYPLYGLWIVLSILGKIFLGFSWWVATSWVWFPLLFLVSVALFILVAVAVGEKLREIEEKKHPDACENCVFNQVREFDEEHKCLGEKFGETDRPCKFHNRERTRNPFEGQN